MLSASSSDRNVRRAEHISLSILPPPTHPRLVSPMEMQWHSYKQSQSGKAEAVDKGMRELPVFTGPGWKADGREGGKTSSETSPFRR